MSRGAAGGLSPVLRAGPWIRPETVLGDFGNVQFEHLGDESRFFVRDGRYFVETMGPSGQNAEFESRVAVLGRGRHDLAVLHDRLAGAAEPGEAVGPVAGARTPNMAPSPRLRQEARPHNGLPRIGRQSVRDLPSRGWRKDAYD